MTIVPVVAVALIRADNRVLMQRRRKTSAFGGLWEFPGGKVESGESPESALIREIHEELGIGLNSRDLSPISFASDPAQPPLPRAPHVILLYSCRSWSGEPTCIEAEAIDWYAIDQLQALAMPPLDYPLARALAANF